MIYTKSFTVNEPSENYIRHVNNLRYLEWFIEAATEHAETLGWGMQACKEMNLAWVATSHTIEYKAPAYQNDELQIDTWIEHVSNARIKRCYICYRGDQLLAKASTVWVLVDYNGEKPRSLPKSLKEKFHQACLER